MPPSPLLGRSRRCGPICCRRESRPTRLRSSRQGVCTVPVDRIVLGSPAAVMLPITWRLGSSRARISPASSVTLPVNTIVSGPGLPSTPRRRRHSARSCARRTLQRLGAWVEPVLVAEWARLVRRCGERMGGGAWCGRDVAGLAGSGLECRVARRPALSGQLGWLDCRTSRQKPSIDPDAPPGMPKSGSLPGPPWPCSW